MPYPFYLVPQVHAKTYAIPTVFKMPMKPLFSNNSQVYYKNHSLSSGTVGSVRNGRRISRST